MKKLLALILTLILSVSVASCGCSKKDKDKKPETNPVENKQEETVQNKEEKDVPKNKVIVANEKSDTKSKTEEIYENYKGNEANSANMYNLFKLLNIVDIKDTAMKVNVNGNELVYRIINNEKFFDVSPIAYAKVSAAIYAIYPEIQNIRFEMEYQGNDYNIYYFDSINDVAKYLGSDYYNAQTLAKARESEDSLKKYLGEIDKVKVPQVSLDDAVKKCTDFGELASFTFKQYDDKKVEKHSFILPNDMDLPPFIDNLYFLNDDIFEGFEGKPVELIKLNVKQINIEKPVNYNFLFCGDELIYFGNVDGYEDLSLKFLRYGPSDEMMELFRNRYMELNTESK